jgi:hypothetical protein
MNAFQITSGMNYHNSPTLFTGRLPNVVIICMVSSAAYSGSIHANPFRFQHYDLKAASLRVNSKIVPADRYKMDFTVGKEQYFKGYRTFIDNIGYKHGNGGPLVTPELWKDGAFFLAFDLSPDKCGNFHRHLSDRGNVQLDLEFDKALTEAVTLIAYASYEDEVQLDADRVLYTSAGIAA